MWEPDLIDCLDNILARGRELEKKRREVADSATPSIWIEDEVQAYDKARKAFDEKLNERIDERIEEAIKNIATIMGQEDNR